MLRRFLALTGLASLAFFGHLSHARATGAWLPSGSANPVEQRVALAIGPSRTTLWTSLRADAAKGPFGVIVPVPPGTAIDLSSDAWLEALDIATAPRVFPPLGASPSCPDEPTPPTPFHVTSDLGKTSGIKPLEVVVLANAAAVTAWVNDNSLLISSDVSAAIASMTGKRFVAARFEAPGGPFTTATLRLALPSPEPIIPLTITRAGVSDLRVTTWVLGQGRALFTGASPVILPDQELFWNAATSESNYVTLRSDKLAEAGPSAVLVESASHASLVENTPIAGGKASITGVVTGFFQLAAGYGDGSTNYSPCAAAAALALGTDTPVAASCPRADLGVVDGQPTCVESPQPGELDPELLRCGAKADDLAVALSGIAPSSAWLTRATMHVPKSQAGASFPVVVSTFTPSVNPVRTTSALDLGGCTTNSGSTNSSSSTGATTSSGGQGVSNGAGGPVVGAGGGYDPYPSRDVGCACAGTADPGYYDEVGGSGGSGGGDDYYDDTSSDDCEGDTSEDSGDTYDDTSGDDCDGDTSDDSGDTYDDSSSDDCDGDTSDGSGDDTSDDTSSDSSSDDCEGDTSDGSSGGDSSSTDDSSGSTDSTDSTDSSSSDSPECAIARKPAQGKGHKKGPRASVLVLGLLALVTPLRRFTRPDRKRQDRKDKRRKG